MGSLLCKSDSILRNLLCNPHHTLSYPEGQGLQLGDMTTGRAIGLELALPVGFTPSASLRGQRYPSPFEKSRKGILILDNLHFV